MRCPKCEAELAQVPAGSLCPRCGAALDDSVETTHVGWAGSTARAQKKTADAAPVPREPRRPVLGFVVVYARSADSKDAGYRLGRLIPLRKGDVFHAGRPPAPATVIRSDGEAVPPAAMHLFPSTPGFELISRRHLTVEMEENDVTLVTDYSTNGIYLRKAGRYSRRTPDQTSQLHRLEGNETIVLGLDLSSDPAAAEQAGQQQLLIVRPAAGGFGA